jgi:hypothetical protein
LTSTCIGSGGNRRREKLLLRGAQFSSFFFAVDH